MQDDVPKDQTAESTALQRNLSAMGEDRAPEEAHRAPIADASALPVAGLRTLQPAGWPAPKGYANGMAGAGTIAMTGGQIGWDEHGRFAEGFVAQVAQTLKNILAVLAEAGAGPQHIARLTWYVVDMDEYRAALPELGRVYRTIMGTHFPAMALVQVVRLVEPEARVEIEATAIV